MSESAFPFGSRGAGILLHVSSLPGPFGIGDFGPPALRWIDRLADAGLGWWQFLPLSPPGRGNSPYEPFSTFALNELFVSPEWLVEDGLLDAADLSTAAFDDRAVDYERVEALKMALWERAHENFRSKAGLEVWRQFDEFCNSQGQWLDDYALFRALREEYGHANFREWPGAIRRREPAALARARQEAERTVERFRFAQFVLDQQQQRLRQYARQKGVRLIGDVPFLVALNSADVWSHPELFLLDAEGQPAYVAGVPPDYFSADGQLWGNPLYDWDAHARAGYAWWIDRIRSVIAQVDGVRLDHFRAFAAAWHIPAGSLTAKIGEWRPGPGARFFEAAQRKLGPLPLIAEDLGLITADVVALREQFHFPGMRVLQFAFDGDAENPFLPENYPAEVVAYTATHDNNTTRGWFESLSAEERQFVLDFFERSSLRPDEIAAELIRIVWESRALLAMTPLQDVLSLGTEARVNWPGRSAGNWRWRATDEQVTARALERMADLTRRTGRALAPSSARPA
jgi:4-alpha-glucanotransferase